MKRGFSFMTLMGIAILAIASNLSAGVPDSLAFQGQLTGSAGTVVPDGDYVLILSLWTDSLGGTMVWSEDRPVTTKSGLFATCLGCGSETLPDVLTGQTLFLQTQLAGQPPMEPRNRLRSVPFSVSSSSLHGQNIVPGGGIVSAAVSSVTALGGGGGGAASAGYAFVMGGDSDGDGHDDFFVADSAMTNLVRRVTGGDLDDDGQPDLAADLEVRVDRIEMKLYDDSDALQRTSVSQSVSSDSASHRIGTDLDGDGQPDLLVASATDATNARLSINTKGTGAKRLSAGTDCDDEASTSYLDCDDDGDGVAESSFSGTSNSDGAEMTLKTRIDGTPARISTNFTVSKQSQGVDFGQRFDSDGDGLAETSMSSSVQRKSGSIIYLDREGNEVLRSMVGVDSTKGVVSTDSDSDGDGIPEDEAVIRVTPGTSSVAIKTKGTGADKDRTMSISATTDGSSSAVHRSDYDDDGDGVPEQEIAQTVLPTTSSMAIKTKGTGSDKDRVISSTTDTSKALTVHSADIDGDGFEDAVVSTSAGIAEVGGIPGGVVAGRIAIKTKGTAADGNRAMSISATTNGFASAVHRSDYDDDGDGVPEQEVSQTLTPVSSNVAIKTKGTAADANRTASTTSTTELGHISTVSAIDDDGDGLSDLSIEESVTSTEVAVLYGSKKGYDYYAAQSLNRASLVMRDSLKDTTFFVDGDGRIGVGKPADAVKRIDVAGGAYCDGSNWVNASDARLKENFRPVDGEQLLKKLEALAITQWNYKNSGDKATHIGPTAQEFYSAFGVGDDSLSISTIDPSGVALAAIKELSRRSRELDQKVERIAELETQINELKAIVSKLAAQGEI